MEIYTDRGSGRRYTVDPATGRSRWLDDPAPASLSRTQELPQVPAGPDGYRDGSVNTGWYLEAPRRAGGAAMKVLGTLVVLVVLVAALILVLSHARGQAPASSGAPSGQGPAPSRTAGRAPAPAKAAPRAATIGTPVRDGKFEFTVTGTRTTKELGNELVSTTADGQFVLVSIRVRNVSDKDKTFVSIAQKLYDTQGREYRADARAAVYLWEIGNLLDRIGPGESVQGTVVFDIPADARADHIELHDSLLSGGTEVVLKRAS